jgi:hypothetical protein
MHYRALQSLPWPPVFSGKYLYVAATALTVDQRGGVGGGVVPYNAQYMGKRDAHFLLPVFCNVACVLYCVEKE